MLCWKFVGMGIALSGLLQGAVALAADAPAHKARSVRFVSGTFYGPGHMADTAVPPGVVSHLNLSVTLEGTIEQFNNGAESPNLESEARVQPPADGLLSNGRPFNEHTNGGIIEVGRGAMRFLAVTVGDGPSKGVTHSFLDSDFNWHMVVDFALDPGFPEGVIVIDRLDITTGIVKVTPSLQSVGKMPGGTDRAGSLNAGTEIVGRAGDYNADGLLDGVFVGVTNIPLQHIFLPGAPAALERTFDTDIPIAPADAAVLAIASARNLKSKLATKPDEAAWDELFLRLDSAAQLLTKVPTGESARRALANVREQATACRETSHGTALDQLFTSITELRSRLAAKTRVVKGATRHTTAAPGP